MNQRIYHNHHTAFSLVELSIVLVVLGLIVGGILTGQSLIKAAELRSQIQQMEEYEVAINTFKEKYFGYPGDIRNATSFWPAQTSNGDGDDNIEAANPRDSSYTTADNHNFNGERPHFFKQLSLAGFVSETFDGSRVIGAGYPRTTINNAAGIFISGPWQQICTGSCGNHLYNNMNDIANARLYLYLGVCNPSQVETPTVSSTHNDSCGTLTIEQMYQIEKKIDDGIPKSGKILAHAYVTTPLCSTNSGQEYNLAQSTERTCNMLYNLSNN